MFHLKDVVNRDILIDILCMSQICYRRDDPFYQERGKKKVDEFSDNIFCLEKGLFIV